MKNHILVVDDDPEFNAYMTVVLRKNGYQCATALSGAEALRKLQDKAPDLILLDIMLKDYSGLELCQAIHANEANRNVPVIFVTGTDNEKIIYQCYESGGVDYIGKPIRNYELLAKVKVHLSIGEYQLRISEIEHENTALKNQLLADNLQHPEAFADIVTTDPELHRIFKYIEVIAASSRSVLISGETGAGKELIAQALHRLSGRSGELVSVNISGLDDLLLSDTLFGHQRSAFTGADSQRSGLIEKAAGGTLFLDEIGDLRSDSQLKLLRLLQNEDYYPLGSDEPKLLRARVIAATNCDLEAKISEKKFREDLYYRLMTHHIRVPPLRERKNDIPLLLVHFMQKSVRSLGCKEPRVPTQLLSLLEQYHFPGNIRELEALVFDAVSRSENEILYIDGFREKLAASRLVKNHGSEDKPTNKFTFAGDRDSPTLKELNNRLIERTLENVNGNIAQAAQLLGISKQALYKRKKKK